jgi:hypothetical protein
VPTAGWRIATSATTTATTSVTDNATAQRNAREPRGRSSMGPPALAWRGSLGVIAAAGPLGRTFHMFRGFQHGSIARRRARPARTNGVPARARRAALDAARTFGAASQRV